MLSYSDENTGGLLDHVPDVVEASVHNMNKGRYTQLGDYLPALTIDDSPEIVRQRLDGFILGIDDANV